MCDYVIEDRVRADCVWCNTGCQVVRVRQTSPVNCTEHNTSLVHHIGECRTRRGTWLDIIRLVCIRTLGPGEEITYFYGNRLYIMDEIGPVPAGKVNTKAGFSLHEEV